MVFEPVYETLKAEGLSPVLKTQAVVEARLTPPEGTEIQRLLSVSAVSSVSAAEIFSGEARYNGSVDFKALYLAGDGTVGIMETRAEFGDKIADEAVKAKTDAFFRSSVLDVDASGCTAQQFTPACVVEICLFCGDSKEIRHLADCTGDIFDKREKVRYLEKAASGQKKFALPVSHANSAIEKLLSVSAAVCEKPAAVSDGFIEAEGELTVTFLGLGSGGMPVQEQVKEPFRHEIDAEDIRRGDCAAVFVSVAGVSTRGISEDGAITYETEAEMEVAYSAYSAKEFETVADAFSTSVECIEEKQKSSVCEELVFASFRDTVTGTVTLDIGNAPVDNVLCFDAVRVNVTGCYSHGNSVTAEGIVGGSVVYYSEDGGKIYSVNVELPFSVTQPAELGKAEDLFVTAAVTGHSIRARRANELNIKAEVSFYAAASRQSEHTFIAGISEGEEKSGGDAAITLHFAAKNEGIWDVAKSAGCSPDDITAQNPDLALPLRGGERILVYKNVKEKF